MPAGEPLLQPYLDGLNVTRFGDGGDVWLDGETVVAFGERLDLELPFTARHQRATRSPRSPPRWRWACARAAAWSVADRALRGERIALPSGVTIINDCYNASPLSMRAALDELSAEPAEGRRLAVLGDMLELGEQETEMHREIGAAAAAAGVDLLVTVGPRAAAMLDVFDGDSYAVADAAEAAALAGELIEPGDVVLVKGSRGIGLEVVAEALAHG